VVAAITKAFKVIGNNPSNRHQLSPNRSLFQAKSEHSVFVNRLSKAAKFHNDL
jgi:hypothetical protein